MCVYRVAVVHQLVNCRRSRPVRLRLRLRNRRVMLTVKTCSLPTTNVRTQRALCPFVCLSVRLSVCLSQFCLSLWTDLSSASTPTVIALALDGAVIYCVTRAEIRAKAARRAAQDRPGRPSTLQRSAGDLSPKLLLHTVVADV